MRVHVYIEGEVQGVCFRAYTRHEATRLGLTGWVRNLPDGRVEAVFEGDPANVEEMVKWCRHGPSYASVQGVKVHWGQGTGEFEGFEVRY